MLEFIYLPLFERTRKGVLDDAEMKSVEDDLLTNPRAGAVIVATGGVRKVRAAREGRGKSGSVRVVYLYVEEQETVYFVLASQITCRATSPPIKNGWCGPWWSR
jgi:mRNA-degrading endonuclease RelE of RelBE toxin-antitoxin system